MNKRLPKKYQDSEYIHDNIDLTKNEYQPKKPGKDYKKIIPHRHVDNDVLGEFAREGEQNYGDVLCDFYGRDNRLEYNFDSVKLCK